MLAELVGDQGQDLDIARLTTTQMLLALRTSSDSAAWEAFLSRFGPTVEAFARKLGMTDADAADIAQEALTEFVQHYQAGRYDRTKGRLGAWVMGIARNRILDMRRRYARRREYRGDSALADLPSDEHLSVIFEEEYRRVLFDRAMTEL